MKSLELLEAIGDVREPYVYAAGKCRKDIKQYNPIRKRRVLLIAAIIVMSLLLMGSAVIIRLTLATAPEYPLLNPSEIPPESIHLSVSDVTSTSMHIYCTIDGVQDGVNDIFIHCNGPFTIERKIDGNWEPLVVKNEDPAWDPENVRTKGSTDWIVNWSTPYGALTGGTYRFTTTVLEEGIPVSVEFFVPEEESRELPALVNEILESEFYHIRYITSDEFGSMDRLNRDGRRLIESEFLGKNWTEEFWKNGDDMLYTSTRNDQLWTGMLYRDGIKYQLDHEGNDRNNPVRGWSPWPDGDMFWLTSWTSLANADINTLEIEYREDGTISRVSREVSAPQFNGYDVEVTHKEEWIFLTDDPAEIAMKIDEQNTETALQFSWEEDIQKMKSLEVAYRNTSAEPVATASQAIKLAMEECTVAYDKILVYRDEEAKMWKVEFQIEYGYQGYQFIYLNDAGITQMVSALGSKVPEWKEFYPDP